MLMNILIGLVIYSGIKVAMVLAVYLVWVYYDDDKEVLLELLPLTYWEFVAVYKLLKRIVNKCKNKKMI